MFDHPVWRKQPVTTAYRLLTSIIRRAVPNLNKAVIAYDEGRARIEVDVCTPFGYAVYRYGHHDPDIALVKRLLVSGDIFVDGGSHIGFYTLAAAAQIGPKGKVIAFEPAERTRKSLLRNLELSHFTWVDVRSQALADRSETRNFFTFGEEAWGSSSFAPPDTVAGQQTENVETITLDAALSAIDLSRIRLIKLDLEGAELAALHGACSLLASAQPDLLFEAEPEHLARQGASIDAILTFLRPYGYHFFRPVEEQGALVLVSDPQPERKDSSVNLLATTSIARLKQLGIEIREEV